MKLYIGIDLGTSAMKLLLMDAEGKIHCHCPKEEEGDYEAEIRRDGVLVTCRRCHASKLIAADSLISAHEFLNADSLELE